MTTFCAKRGNGIRKIIITSFWESEGNWFSHCSWRMKGPSLCRSMRYSQCGKIGAKDDELEHLTQTVDLQPDLIVPF